jgi:phosphatidylinositol phospholipase C delta
MPLLTPSGKQFSLHKLMAMSTMMSSPAHGNHGFIGNHIHPLIQAGGGDALSEVSAHQLYLSNEIQDHLQRVYDNLRGQEKALSHDKFVDFLEKTQGQPMEGMHRECYKFEEFLEVVYYNHGFEIVKPAPPEKDLSKPISNYFISSSHNTYVSGNQLTSKSSTEAYKNVSRIFFISLLRKAIRAPKPLGVRRLFF